MTTKRFLAVVFILICTTVAWIVLGASVAYRSLESSSGMARSISTGWGPPMTQQSPAVYYQSPGAPGGRRHIQPTQSRVDVRLQYEPKKRGLVWYRTYGVDFRATYTITNPTPISQTMYVRFELPGEQASYTDFSFQLKGAGGEGSGPGADGGKSSEPIVQAVTLGAGESTELSIAYRSRGTDQWLYSFGDVSRIRNFELAMRTNFEEIDFPVGTGSPTARQTSAKGGWELSWSYPDVLGAQPIGMAMPKALNPGQVAARVSFFAPVSLLFFFSVLLIMAAVRDVSLHPMNYFFLAAGLFAFQLLFAYLVDLVPIHLAFAVAALVSLLLVSGYLFLAVGRSFARLAALAQLAYMVLFSYSFFFDGLTGLTITLGSIVTLALLMIHTARVNWGKKFA